MHGDEVRAVVSIDRLDGFSAVSISDNVHDVHGHVAQVVCGTFTTMLFHKRREKFSELSSLDLVDGIQLSLFMFINVK